MNAEETQKGVLRIRHMHNEYLVSSDHPAPTRIQAMLDRVATENLAQTLIAALNPWFSNSDSSVWLIRQLDVELDVNAEGEQEQLAKVWAVKIAQSMAITLQGGGDGENVLWFPDRAAYLARFLMDVTDGLAWGKWYFESFAGLKPLPVSAVLRTAVCEQPRMGEKALRQLPSAALNRVIRTLTTADARQIVESLSDDVNHADEFSLFKAAWTALCASGWESFNFCGEWQNALRLYLAASPEQGGGLKLKSAVLALLNLVGLVKDDAGISREALLEALALGDKAALYLTVGTANAERLTPLLRCPADWVKEVGVALTTSAKAEGVADLRFTPFGGLFLLFPLLDEWPLTKATQGWPDTDDISAATLLRLVILAECCGQPNVSRVFHDGLIRELLGIPADFSIAMLYQWQQEISAAHCQTFLNVMADWLFQRGAIDENKFILCLSDEVLVLIDGTRGMWLTVAAFSPGSPDCLSEAVRTRLERATLKGELIELVESASIPPLLLCDPDIFLPARSVFPLTRVYRLDEDQTKQIAEEDGSLAEILVRLGKLPDDLDYLASPKSWHLPDSFNHMLTVSAQNLLRSFAWRLPGFAHSNLPYLYENFLDFPANVEDEPERRVVRIGRPPLHLILNMTGIARGSYPLGWLDSRPLALFPEQ